jgi:uncharacterized membrane protein HdeD (DUF308 family)
MGLNEFLAYLAGGSGAALVVSWIFEQWAWYSKQTPAFKQWFYFFGCAVISLGAYAVMTFVPAEVLTTLAPYFAIIAVAFGSAFSGSLFHKNTKLTK